MAFRSKRTAAAVLAALTATAAWGQAQKVERIEVTGSNIKRVDAETASPVQILKREDIEKSGATSVSEVIRSLPVDNNGSVSDAFGIGFAAGASGVSLRGLTVNSTLVLLNGRRMAPYGLADDGQRTFVDLNTIPLDAVDRIEIVKDGASAIYGSDAIAGVVNVILRKDFQGATANVSAGTSQRGDGDEYRASFTAGKGDPRQDRYNAFVNVELTSREAIMQRDRGSYVGTNDLRFMGFTDQRVGNPVDPLSGASSVVGNVRPIDPATGLPTGGLTSYVSLPGCNPALVDSMGYCRWSTVDYAQVQPEVKRANVLGRVTYAFSDALEAYAEASLFTTKTKTMTTPTPSSSTWANVRDLAVVTSSTLFLPVGHPDNPFNDQHLNARLRYVFADVGARRNEYETQVKRVVGGLKGTAAGWDFDTGAGYVESTTDRTSNGYVRYSVFQQMIADHTYRFGGHVNSAAALAQLAPTLENSTKSSTTFVDARASRELVELPGGPLAIALGADYRKEKLESPPTPYTYEGDIIGLGYSSFFGDRNVTAAYAELSAPIVRTVELTAAARVDHYSDVGNSTTPKLGVKWTPLRSLAMRATYAEGFRAPGPAESGNSSTSGFTSFVDPVRCDVTDDPRDCGASSTVVLTTGNPSIKPEKSKSATIGFVFEPLQGTSMSLDWYHIERRDEILSADANVILANPGAYPGAQVIRDQPDVEYPNLPGRVLAVTAPYQNGSRTTTSGFDLDMAHRFALPGGRLTANLVMTYVKAFRRTQPTGEVLEYVGTHGPTSLSGNGGTPRVRGSFRLSYDSGPLTATGIANFVSGMRGIESAGSSCLNDTNYHNPDECRIASFTWFDLTGSYKLSRNVEVYGAVKNLFDRLPPYDPQTYGAVNFNPTFHLAGAIGRFFSVGARYTW